MNIFNKPIIWAIIIFICAAIFRLTFLDLMEFKLDEARDVYEMEKFFSEPYFIQRGTIQSTGVYNPPLWYYILAILSLTSRDPQYLSFMIALINCAAVAGFYLVVKKFYGQFMGVASGLLLAFSPWAILFSRKIWAPDLILPLLVPLFYFLHKKNAFWVVLLLSLLAQLHASGLFLAVATVITVLVMRIKINWKSALLGLIISLIPLLPYIAFQFQTGCGDCQAFFNYRDEAKVFDANVFLRPFELISGSSFAVVAGEDQTFVKVFNMIFLLEFILAILGIIYIIRKERKYLWLLIFLGVVPLLYLITQTPAHMYYFVIVMPIMIIIYTLGIVHLGGVLANRSATIRGVLLAVVIIINIIFEIFFYKFLWEKQNIEGDFGPIYKLTRQKVDTRLQNVRDHPDYELIKAESFVREFLAPGWEKVF